MSSQTKIIKNIQHFEIATVCVARIIGTIIRGGFKLAALFCATRAKHCHNMIADIHEAVRYSESQGTRSDATKAATSKRIAKLQADAVHWENRQKNFLTVIA